MSPVESLTCTYGENDHSAAPCATLLETVVTSQYHSSCSKQVPQFCFKIRLLLNSFLVMDKNPAETEALKNKLEWIFVYCERCFVLLCMDGSIIYVVSG